MTDYTHCRDASAELGETNDCTVRACAVATGIDYKTMHKYLADEYGRKKGRGLSQHQYHRALEDLGFKITPLEGPKYEYTSTYIDGHHRYNRRSGYWSWVEGQYRTTRRKAGKGKDYNGATVTTVAKELTKGTYFLSTDGHVACLKDGEVHDFTKNRRHRIIAVYRVEEA